MFSHFFYFLYLPHNIDKTLVSSTYLKKLHTAITWNKVMKKTLNHKISCWLWFLDLIFFAVISDCILFLFSSVIISWLILEWTLVSIELLFSLAFSARKIDVILLKLYRKIQNINLLKFKFLTYLLVNAKLGWKSSLLKYVCHLTRTVIKLTKKFCSVLVINKKIHSFEVSGNNFFFFFLQYINVHRGNKKKCTHRFLKFYDRFMFNLSVAITESKIMIIFLDSESSLMTWIFEDNFSLSSQSQWVKGERYCYYVNRLRDHSRSSN